MSATARFALPLLYAGQAQKELFFNEALTLADALVQACVEAVGIDIPPSDPDPGHCWIVGTAPTGEWSAVAGALALWTESGWRFTPPREGMTAWSAGDELPVHYMGGSWRIGRIAAAQLVIDGEQVVGAREPAVEDPDGGGVVDAEARTAIEGILAALRGHGLIDSA